MDRMIGSLIERLVEAGVEITAVPDCVRTLLIVITANPRMPLEEINRRMQLLGWSDVTLEADTFRLISALFDVEMESRDAERPAPRYA
jgi:hypothetical protein